MKLRVQLKCVRFAIAVVPSDVLRLCIADASAQVCRAEICMELNTHDSDLRNVRSR